jgi:hypothetical protein
MPDSLCSLPRCDTQCRWNRHVATPQQTSACSSRRRWDEVVTLNAEAAVPLLWGDERCDVARRRWISGIESPTVPVTTIQRGKVACELTYGTAERSCRTRSLAQKTAGATEDGDGVLDPGWGRSTSLLLVYLLWSLSAAQ